MTDVRFEEGDLNGDCFIAGAEGEPELLSASNVVYIPFGMATQIDANAGDPVVVSAGNANRFLKVNFQSSRACERTIEVAAKVAFIRLIAVRSGLVSEQFPIAAHNVKYNNCILLTEAETTARIAEIAEGELPQMVAVLTPEVRKTIRLHFADYTCCIAYVFRVRGHHYKDEFEDRYVSLWARCLKRPTDLAVAWKFLATDALHAIMPDILDDFWGYCVDSALCAGTLIKRFDSAPAGCAGVSALKRGLDDVTMLFPKVVERVPSANRAFADVLTKLGNSRWGGSINCRFYGVPRIRVDESKIGALASVVMGVYEQLAHDSKLRESPALKRLAEIAPATGGALGIAALRATKDQRLNLIGATDAVAESEEV